MPSEDPSRRTLDDLWVRALTFLRATGTSPRIRSILAAVGYTPAEHDLGWALAHKASGYQPERADFAPDADPAVRDAINEIDGWDEPNFARAKAALERYFPAQAKFVFDELEPAQGVESVVSVSTFLDRLDILESGEGRKATRKEDQGAVKLLAERGIDAGERKRLRQLIATVEKGTSGAPASDTEATAAADTDRRSEQEAALRDLYYWFKDWSTTARVVIKRRDYLIRLGLAKRKVRGAASDEDTEPETDDGPEEPATEKPASDKPTKG